MALTRTRYPIPDYIRRALTERGLLDAYRTRQEGTREKRLAHTCPGCRCRGMLEELEGWNRYMKMKWHPK